MSESSNSVPKPSALAAMMSRGGREMLAVPRVASRTRDQAHDAIWTKKRAIKKVEEKKERARKAALKATERTAIRTVAEQAANREILRAGWASAPSVLDAATLERFDEALLAPPPYHGNSNRDDKDAIKEAATNRGGRASFDRDSSTWFVEDRRTMLALMKTGVWHPVVLEDGSYSYAGDNPYADVASAHLTRQLERLLAPRHGAAAVVTTAASAISASSASSAATPAPKRPRPSDVPADAEEDLDSLEALGVPRGAAPLLVELPSTVLGPHAGISAVARVVRALRVGPLVASHVEMHYARHVEGVLTADEFRRRVCGVCVRMGKDML